MFENLARRRQSGVLPVDVWRATCRGHQQFYAAVIREIDASSQPNEPGIPGTARLVPHHPRMSFKRLESGHSHHGRPAG